MGRGQSCCFCLVQAKIKHPVKRLPSIFIRLAFALVTSALKVACVFFSSPHVSVSVCVSLSQVALRLMKCIHLYFSPKWKRLYEAAPAFVHKHKKKKNMQRDTWGRNSQLDSQGINRLSFFPVSHWKCSWWLCYSFLFVLQLNRAQIWIVDQAVKPINHLSLRIRNFTA